MEVGTITTTGRNHCRFCDRTFYHTKPEINICRMCYYHGCEQEERIGPEFFDEMANIPGVKTASIDHTGGGCWALTVTRKRDTNYIMGTIAFKDDAGEWSTDADVPETPDGPWCVAQYTEEGEEVVPADVPTTPGMGGCLLPLDRKTLLAYIRGFASGAE